MLRSLLVDQDSFRQESADQNQSVLGSSCLILSVDRIEPGPDQENRWNYFKNHKKDLDGSTSFEIVQEIKTPDVAPEDCKTIDGNVCITKKDDRADTTSAATTTEKSSAVVAGTSLAAFVALLNLH